MEELCIHHETEALFTPCVSSTNLVSHQCYCIVISRNPPFWELFLCSCSMHTFPVNNQALTPPAIHFCIITQCISPIASSIPLQPTNCKLLWVERQLEKACRAGEANEQQQWMWCTAAEMPHCKKKKKTRQPERGGGGEKEEEEEGVGGCCVETVREGQPRVALLCIRSPTDSFIHWF